jgi:hypothetical protein
MTTHHTAIPTASISPALVAAALDCLAYIPDGHRLEPALLVAVTRTITPDIEEADALLVRIRAAAIVLCDPRWPKWSAYFRAQDALRRAAFDQAVLGVVAALPLDASLKFASADFFDAVLERVDAASCT